MNLKSFCVFLAALASFYTTKGQQAIIDSLERELENSTNGLSRVEVLIELGWYYAYSDADKGLLRADDAIKLAIETNDSLPLGIAYERKGLIYQSMGKDSLTLDCYHKAGEVYTLIGHKRRLAALDYNTANFYFNRSKYRQSLEYINDALEVYTKEADTIRMSRIYNLKALNHMYLGDYSTSMKTFQQGSLLLELTENQETQFFAEILGNLSLLYEKLSDFKKSLDFQNKALAIHKKNDYQIGIANTYSNIGQSYGHLEQHEKALEMFDLSLKIKEKIGNKYGIANGLTNLGIIHYELGDSEAALDFLDRAKSIYIELGHFSNLSTVYKSIADIYLAEGRLPEATSRFESALSYAEKAEDKRAVLLATQGLAESAYNGSEFEKAYRLQEKATLLKDSLLSTEKRDELSKIEATYQYDKEKAILKANFEKDNAIQQAKTEKQVLIRNIIIGGGIFGMLLLAVGFTLFRKKREAELEAKVIASELSTLKAQLNPHFIFNSLNSINDFVQKNERDTASDYLIRFSKMMRKILNDSKAEEVPLDEEIEFLENYMKLEQERLDNKFTFKIEVSGDIDPADTLVPPTLFQPFVENSIWHGLSPKTGNTGTLSINIDTDKDILTCTIDDNGIGINGVKNRENKNHISFGSTGVKTRLELLNQLRGDVRSKIEFVPKEEGVRVKIQLPLVLDTEV